MRYLLDTNVISEAGKSRGNCKVKNWLLHHEAASAIPSIVIAERSKGAHLSDRRDELLERLEEEVEAAGEKIIPFDAAAALHWGEYVSRPEIRAADPGVRDTFIAAIALSRDMTVVTRNTKHFKGVPTVNPFED